MASLVRTHRPVWRREACLSCQTCTQRCPLAVFPELVEEHDSLRGRIGREVSFPTQRPAAPPCQASCPLGQDVPGYLRALFRGDFDAALGIIYDTNPFPAVCGTLCLHPCMRACLRGTLDAPVQIRALKRAAAAHALKRPAPAPIDPAKGRVEVIGAGPAGLSAAYALRRMGFEVRVHEAREHPGGLLRYAVPSFDLSRKALSADVEAILDSGVSLRCGSPLRSWSDLQALLTQGARAVVLATGCDQGRALGLPGESLLGCAEAISFARTHCEGQGPRLDGPAVVSGSGLVAAAAARLAMRAGASAVTWLMRRSRREVATEQLEAAEREGVRILCETRPVEIVGRDQVEAVRCAVTVFGPEDGAGRRWPEADDTPRRSELFTLPARNFVAAEDRRPELSWLGSPGGDRRTQLGLLAVDPERLSLAGWPVFGAGEVVLGPRNVVAAVASGQKAARAVKNLLEGEKP